MAEIWNVAMCPPKLGPVTLLVVGVVYNLPSPACGTAYLTGYLYNIVTAIYLIIDAGGQPMKHQFLLAPAPSPEPTQAESEVKKCNDWQTTGDGTEERR